MISKRVKGRKDGKSSAGDSLRYGEGLKVDRETGEYLDKSHRTRIGGFGLVDDGVYAGLGIDEMTEILGLAAIEMQANCDLNTRVRGDKRIAHFVVSYDQDKPSEAVLRDTEDSMLAALKLDKNHFSTFLHNDNGYWHLHIFASRIEKTDRHRGNLLWNDQTIRDKVCREIEIRHELKRDKGMHEIGHDGSIVQIPLAERRAQRKLKQELKPEISDKARTKEIYSGEKSFQSWANEIRIGDRLKHAKSWPDIHAAAAAYKCEIKPKGAGFIICPTGETGGLQLSKIGLKNLPAKFGAFQPAKPNHQVHVVAAYTPAPLQEKATSHYDKWRDARNAFKLEKTEQLNEQRETHKALRIEVRAQHKAEITSIRSAIQGPDKVAAISIAKMRHTVEVAALGDRLVRERKQLRAELAKQGPGNTFRDYIVLEAGKGDNIALGLARKYGVDSSTEVLARREADQLSVVAAVSGPEYRSAQRMDFTHRIERNGTVVYDFGGGRTVTDSAVARQVQLNDAAAHSPDAVATALRFAATKFGNKLALTGSTEFQRLAVETAVLHGLRVDFLDPGLQAYKQEFAASINRARPLTPKQMEKGIANVLARNRLGKPPAHVLARSGIGRPAEHVIRAQQHTEELAAEGSSRLHELSTSGMDGKGSVDRSILPNVVPGGVGDKQAGKDSDVRWSRPGAAGSRGRRPAGSDTAEGRAGSGAGGGAGAGVDGRSIRPVTFGENRGITVDGNRLPVAGAQASAEMSAHDPYKVPPVSLTAKAWFVKWSADERKVMGSAMAENGKVAHQVIYIAEDGVVLDKGRSGAVYPVPTGFVVNVGDRVAVNSKAQICMLQAVEVKKDRRER